MNAPCYEGGDMESSFKDKVAKLTDSALLDMLLRKDEFVREAIEAAEQEIRKRGLDIPTPKTVREITQKYTLNFFGRSKITALEDKVVYRYKNLREEFTAEVAYKDLSPDCMKYKRADDSLVSIGWAFFGIALCLSLVSSATNNRMLVTAVLSTLVVFGLLCFISVLFRREYIYFYKRNGKVAFLIAMDKKDFPKNKEIADYIISKIQEANRSTNI